VSSSNQFDLNYYERLAVHPSASPMEIRQAYRELSKKYHPDTTTLPPATAMVKFQALNEAYATISNPERRLAYDLKIGYSRLLVVQPSVHFQPLTRRADKYRSSAYLDPTDRPLSGGEIFAVFMLIATFVGCLVLAIAIGIARGELVWR
jgi:curved DNA-binding protein CbpA